MKIGKKLLSVLLSVVMALILCAALGTLSFAATPNVIDTGSCGDAQSTLTWTLTDDHTLTITGQGCMEDYQATQANPNVKAPWTLALENYLSGLLMPYINNELGTSFTSLSDLENAVSTGTVTAEAFQNAVQNAYAIVMRATGWDMGISTLVIGEGVTGITNSFDDCQLMSITLPSTLTTVPVNALHLQGGLLTVNGANTDISEIVFGACSVNYPFNDVATQSLYFTVTTCEMVAMIASEYVNFNPSQQQLQDYLNQYCLATEQDAFNAMRKPLYDNAMRYNAQFGFGASDPVQLTIYALDVIDSILGTNYCNDYVAGNLTVNWGFSLLNHPALCNYFFGGQEPDLSTLSCSLASLPSHTGYKLLPWTTVKAPCNSLAAQQIVGSGAAFESTGGHVWGSWTVTTPATATAAGLQTRECSVCHETEEDVIPATGTETPTQPTNPTQPQNPTNPGGNNLPTFFNRILAFFQRIVLFFQNLFHR